MYPIVEVDPENTDDGPNNDEEPKVCKEVEKPHYALEIEPIETNTLYPGHYFKFKEEDAKEFFNADPWYKYKGTYKMLNSCGDIEEVKIFRNAKNCDSTDATLQCGRMEAHSSPVIQTWTYEHVGKNIGQKRWIAKWPLEPKREEEVKPPRCKEVERPEVYMEITPITENTSKPGRYFEFDANDGFAFFKKTPKYAYKGDYKVLNSCGEELMVKVYRNAKYCDNDKTNIQQCGRFKDSKLAVAGSWEYEHVGSNVGQKRWIALIEDESGKQMETNVGATSEGYDVSDVMMVAVPIALFGLGYYFGTKTNNGKYQQLIPDKNIEMI